LDGNVSEFSVSVSIGVAESLDATRVHEAFGLADKAAYASKKAGKAVVTRASELLSV
jgi:GGDEF domain-containing protein